MLCSDVFGPDGRTCTTMALSHFTRIAALAAAAVLTATACGNAAPEAA
ncbi:MAG: hypothetical protein H7Y15_15825, partial [Pseudonocardia sp.]|nr:hypothetical protein [Pseudonocardia sp.]